MPLRKSGVSVPVLREAAAMRVADTSLRQAAREIGISHQALAAFLNGSEPYGPNLAKLREWHARETNEVLRLRQENAALRKRVAELEKQARERTK
jgi:DNA transposition AAA+ family ATPase